jgi:Short C-terminal domain
MPGLLRGVARTAVVAGTATAVSNRVSRRQAGRWADQEQQQYEHEQYAQQQQAQQYPPQSYPQQQAYPQQPAAAASGDMSDKLAQLQQLGELKAQGVLTDAEFEQQKARILAS